MFDADMRSSFTKKVVTAECSGSDLDDYLIESASDLYDSEEDKEIFHSENSSNGDDEESNKSGDGMDSSLNLQEQVLMKMEQFFDNNYEHRHVLTMDDIYHERVWKAEYDNKFDLLYLFTGKIKQKKGVMFSKIGQIFAKGDSLPNVADFPFDDRSMTAAEAKAAVKKLSATEKVLRYFKDCTVSFQLILQVWNVEDRHVRDRNFRKKPVETFTILDFEEEIKEPMNTFDQMNYL